MCEYTCIYAYTYVHIYIQVHIYICIHKYTCSSHLLSKYLRETEANCNFLSPSSRGTRNFLTKFTMKLLLLLLCFALQNLATMPECKGCAEECRRKKKRVPLAQSGYGGCKGWLNAIHCPFQCFHNCRLPLPSPSLQDLQSALLFVFEHHGKVSCRE